MSSVLESPPEQLDELFDQRNATPVQVEPAPVQTAASLMSGIIGDLQSLVEQQFQLTRMQIAADLRERVVASAVLVSGVLLLLVSAIFVCLSISHLLHWITSPPGIDTASLPLWACHAVVAAILILTGGIMANVGRAQFKAIPPFRNPITEIIQENLK